MISTPLPLRCPWHPFAVALALLLLALVLPVPAQAMLAGMQSDAETMYAPPEEARATIDRMDEAGVQLLRINVSWHDVADDCGGQSVESLADHNNSCYGWKRLDNLVGHSRERGIQVLA